MIHKSITAFFFLLALFVAANLHAQSEDINWKVLIGTNNKKVWYDATTIDTAKGREFKIWLLELYKPPLNITGLKDPVYKSKTLYKLNLNIQRYGLSEILYYNASDKQIAKYNYDMPNITDEYQYSYPALENNQITALIKKYIKTKELNNK
jgi:hypothetical protein